jgi:hypothetical protein
MKPLTPEDPFAAVPFAVPAAQQRSLERLSEDERTAIESYALKGFDRVNQALRGFRPMTDDIQTQVDQIRSGLQKFRLENDVRVTREVSGSAFNVTDQESVESLVGQLITERGF